MWLKIQLFLLKKKHLIVLIVTLAILLLLYYTIPSLQGCYSEFSETTKGVVGTLIGAIFGGFFTLMGSLAINKSSQKAANERKKKNLIFKPLYDELKSNHNTLKNNPFPHSITRKDGEHHFPGTPKYTVWQRISNDSRIFEVPSKLKDEMNCLYVAIDEVETSKTLAVNAIDRIYRVELKNVTNIDMSVRGNVGDYFLPLVLNDDRPNDEQIMWYQRQANQDDELYKAEADILWLKLKNHAHKDEDICRYVKAHEDWQSVETRVIELLGLYIQYIIERYEG